MQKAIKVGKETGSDTILSQQMGLIFIIFYKIHTFVDKKNISNGNFLC